MVLSTPIWRIHLFRLFWQGPRAHPKFLGRQAFISLDIHGKLWVLDPKWALRAIGIRQIRITAVLSLLCNVDRSQPGSTHHTQYIPITRTDVQECVGRYRKRYPSSFKSKILNNSYWFQSVIVQILETISESLWVVCVLVFVHLLRFMINSIAI